jgi:hypothetical protein
VEKQEQLEWESRVGRFVAAAAFAAAILLLGVLFASGQIAEEPPTGVDADTVFTLGAQVQHRSDLILLTIAQAIATLLLAAPLWYLYEAAKARRPEVPVAAKWLALIAPPVMAVLLVVGQVSYLNSAERAIAALHKHSLPPDAANDFLKDQLAAGAAPVLQALGLAAGLALAFAFVLVALNAMRAGLLSRFMGILGIIAGASLVISLPFVQAFWVGAMGLLALGPWPQGGRGPAWETGEADPWPTARERAEAVAAARAGDQPEEPDEDDDVDDGRARAAASGSARRRVGTEVLDADGDANGSQPTRRQSPEHPRSKKRKRKRR